MDHEVFVPRYDKADRRHMRRFLQKAPALIDLIAKDQIPLGSPASAEWIDELAAAVGCENEKQKDEDAWQELKDDRYSLINLYAVVKKVPAFLPVYGQLSALLCKYGLFDEEVVLLENAVSGGRFAGADRIDLQHRLKAAERCRDADDAAMTDTERIAEDLRRALQKQPPDDVPHIKALLAQCTDDEVLYDIACHPGKDRDMLSIRERAACRIRNRDYQYALGSQIQSPVRCAMIMNLYGPVEEDKPFITRTILTDPDDRSKAHMLLFCQDEALLMLGLKYVYGGKRFWVEQLHAMGSRFPEAYENADPQARSEWEKEWLSHAAELALDLLPEDDAVRDRLAGAVLVDSEPLYFFLSIHHPRKAIRWWYARELKHPARIAYVGSWTSDDQIKRALSVKINSTELITEMLYGDLSGADLVFGFRTPEDKTPQDRFCVEIMKNHPDRTIREHVRQELLRGHVEIPGVDLTKPDPLYKR